jgi:glycosyltransferase involved in cell wall biosynthesis
MNEKAVEVLYISYDGMTDPLGQSQVLPYLSGLAKNNFKITLLSCEKPLKLKQHKALIDKICHDANIEWHPINYTAKPPILSTIKDVYQLHKAAYALHQQKQFKIVHCRSYIAALVGLKMKHKFGTKFLFDMRGFWADERIDGGLWNLKNPLYKIIYKFFKRKELAYFSEADYIISLTEAGKNEIAQWPNFKNRQLPIAVIPCCVDTIFFDNRHFNEQAKYNLLTQLQIEKDSFIMGYVGSIGTWYMLTEMLLCYKQLLLIKANATFLFVSTEPQDIIYQEAQKLGINTNNIIVKAATRQEVPLYISIMHISIFFIKPCFSKKASSPTKQGELMAMGVPIICNAGVGDTDIVIDKYKSGVAIPKFNDTSYNEGLQQILESHFSAIEIRQGAIDFYGLAKGIATYSSVYTILSKN